MDQTRRRLMATVIMAATATVAAPAFASDDPFDGLASRAVLVSVNVAKPSPSHCFGESLAPDTFGNNEVSGPAATRCERFVPQISVKAQLWETRIWGWDRVGTPAQERGADESDVAVVAFGDCRNNTMRTTGQHAATDVDFEEYTAKTNSGGVDIAC